MADAKPLKLYRKRYIPSQCIPLDEDTIVKETDEYIVTTWETIHPKAAFDHGCSCYLLNEGLKVSKFYRPDGTVLYWYCDIITYEKDEEENSLTAVDLLADVIIYPDGRIKVMDLDELAEALERRLITNEEMTFALRKLNNLLNIIDRDKFDRFQSIINDLGL